MATDATTAARVNTKESSAASEEPKDNPSDHSAHEQHTSSRVIMLLNMVKESELEDPMEYQDIMEDITDTCQKYGKLLSVVIPKKGKNGCGRVFLEYQTAVDAKVCIESLKGRMFNGNVIAAYFFDEAAFEKLEFIK
ncbi:hypothetical protein RFI_01587 [Reticulomyxa filosa]|uniref:RRM domain-containing protein n=1 Tax=Reticulomyxa filosa TaxID=46433 RepID=X6PBD2_RETFI|nr:hypothetical protein RFI_01587 [Reticulomyxa filosa]|eukprot:ETO35476.1 hypothetical protein RFI_01587 [Reticulomyxa filosa]